MMKEEEVLEENMEELDDLDQQVFSGLMEAVLNEEIMKVEHLLAQNADINETLDDLYCPIFLAVENNSPKMLECLLKNQASLSIELGGQSILHFTAGASNFSKMDKCLDLLLKENADVNSRDKRGRTPLHICHGENFTSTLIEANADVNAVDSDQESCLYSACSLGDAGKARALLENSADPTLENKDGESAIWIAGLAGHEEIMRLLIENGNDTSFVLNNKTLLWHLAGLPQKNLCFDYLLEAGNFDLNFVGAQGLSILARATESTYTHAVHALLNAKVDANQQMEGGMTALMMAVSEGKHILDVFLKYEFVDVNIQNEDGESAIFIALNEGGGNYRIKIEMLLNTGRVNLDLKNNEQQTILDLAKEEEDEEKEDSKLIVSMLNKLKKEEAEN